MGELLSSLGINGKLLFAQIVNFLIVFFLLGKFVYPKLIKFIEQRKKRIEEGLALTEKAEHEMERIDEARSRELAKAKKEGDAVLSQAKSQADEKERETVSDAKDKAEGITQTAKKDAVRAKQDAVKDANAEIGKTALLFAEKILSRNLTSEDEKLIQKEVLKELDKQYTK